MNDYLIKLYEHSSDESEVLKIHDKMSNLEIKKKREYSRIKQHFILNQVHFFLLI